MVLGKDLEREDVFIGTAFSCGLDLAEFATAEGLADFEIVEGPAGASLGGLVQFFFGVEGDLHGR